MPELDHPDEPRRFSSVLLVDRRGWLLLQERDEHPEIDPERWGCPGGHVEPGESPLEAACRELTEETGVVLPPEALEHWRDLRVRHAGRDQDDLVHVFAAATDLADDDITCAEGRQIVFVDPDRVGELPLTRAAEMGLRPFLDSATYQRLLEPKETA